MIEDVADKKAGRLEIGNDHSWFGPGVFCETKLADEGWILKKRSQLVAD